MAETVLLKGDCLERMKEIPDKSIDLILCDLPYGVTDCKWDVIIPPELLWDAYKRIIKDNGAIILFSTQPFTTLLINSAKKIFRYTWYWQKNAPTGFCFAKYQPMRVVEDICVFYKKAPTYNPQGLIRLDKPKVRKGKRSSGGIYRDGSLQKDTIYDVTNYPKNLLSFPVERGLHPTQKPVTLLEYLIRTYTNPGETVLDNCMGSGSTGVAAMQIGRNFIGIEKEEKYFLAAQERIKKYEEFEDETINQVESYKQSAA